jgi:glutamyl-tRNA reductase
MSGLAFVGVNHRSAPLSARQRLHVSAQQLPGALVRIAERCVATGAVNGKPELVLLSTCNRTEVYAWAQAPQAAAAAIAAFLAETAGYGQPDELCEHLEYSQDEVTVSHLMQVAAGLDSLVTGENEILGQVKDAYTLALQAGACGPVLSALFRRAIQCGKRARAETEIGCLQRSVATVVVDLARELSPNLEQRCALLIGAGKISAMTARALAKAGLRFILVTNRTFEHAQKLAAAYGGQAVHFDALPESLAAADIVICSTGAPHIVLHAGEVAEAMLARPQRPLLIADLAVPRDADPHIAAIPNVRLVDIDGLQETALKHPLAGVVHECIECIVAEETEAFRNWLCTRRRSAVIRQLTQKAEALCAEQVHKTSRRLGLQDPDQQAALQAMAAAIAGQLLHAPITYIKDTQQDDEDLKTLMRVLLGVDSAS